MSNNLNVAYIHYSIGPDTGYRRGRMNENNMNWAEEADIVRQQRILYAGEVIYCI